MTPPDMLHLLAASGPYAPLAGKLMLYGRFVGSWDMAATWHGRDGSVRTGTGGWHFAWVLGGRGVQDVLFASGAPAEQYGTSLRCYDAAMDAWHIIWMQPASGEFVQLTGRQVGENIVQEGVSTDPARRERWSFTEITPDSFLWLGEVSLDGGATWFLEQEMRGRRRRTA